VVYREGEPNEGERKNALGRSVRWLVKLCTGVSPDGMAALHARVGKHLARWKMYREVCGR
jgi:hypothetical protein